jgi:hypothetical protein
MLTRKKEKIPFEYNEVTLRDFIKRAKVEVKLIPKTGKHDILLLKPKNKNSNLPEIKLVPKKPEN